MATETEITSIVEEALDHARTHDYRPLENDNDMLQIGIEEAAENLTIELNTEETKNAVSQMRDCLDELMA